MIIFHRFDWNGSTLLFCLMEIELDGFIVFGTKSREIPRVFDDFVVLSEISYGIVVASSVVLIGTHLIFLSFSKRVLCSR